MVSTIKMGNSEVDLKEQVLDQLVKKFAPFVSDLYRLVNKHKTPGDLLMNFPELQALLMEYSKVHSLLEQCTSLITVMFTDIVNSTPIASNSGDVVYLTFISQYQKILFPIIKEKGKLVKAIGDGTLSYFNNAKDAVRAAIKIQEEIEKCNQDITLQVRIGLHSGSCLVGDKDIYGDIVNVCKRFETMATPGEIFFSEDTYHFIADDKEFDCTFVKEDLIKGKDKTYKIYKVCEKKEVDVEVEEKTKNSAGTTNAGATDKTDNFPVSPSPEVKVYINRIQEKTRSKIKTEEKSPLPLSDEPPVKLNHKLIDKISEESLENNEDEEETSLDAKRHNVILHPSHYKKVLKQGKKNIKGKRVEKQNTFEPITIDVKVNKKLVENI